MTFPRKGAKEISKKIDCINVERDSSHIIIHAGKNNHVIDYYYYYYNSHTNQLRTVEGVSAFIIIIIIIIFLFARFAVEPVFISASCLQPVDDIERC